MAIRRAWRTSAVARIHHARLFGWPQPVIYTGLAVTLDSLQCQLLRDDDTIQRAPDAIAASSMRSTALPAARGSNTCPA
jgi:hypothetical protein